MEDSLSFRLATPQDFEEVQKLSKGIYGGHDYLPKTYQEWLKQDNITIMVAIIAGKIIGLEAQVIVDDGKTAVNRARRIHPDYRGRSYGTRLSEALKTYAEQTFPGICRARLVTTHERDASRNYRELLVQYSVACNVENSLFEVEKLPRAEKQLTVSTREHFADVILSSPVVKNLFPNETLVIDWFPFEAIRSNIDYMLKDGDQLFVEQCSDERLPISFSHGRLTPRTEVLEWTCSIFTQDPELYKAHLIQQITTAARAVGDSFIFLSFQSKSMAKLAKELLFDKVKLTECEFKMKNEEKVILYEKDW